MAPQPASPLPKCVLIATGGTIAMTADPVTHAPVPALSGDDLLRSVPRIAAVASVEVVNLFNLPSIHLEPEHWVALRQAVVRALARDDVAGVMVSHGTDTLEETAWFLDLTVAGPKPVVLFGAQRNASDPDFDGPRNLLNAARLCVSPRATGMGVMVALNGQVNAARDATKTHTSDVESFQSGPWGFLGTVDDAGVFFSRASTRRQHLELARTPLPRVEIVAAWAGSRGDLLRAALQLGAQGIVVQAVGCGNVSADMHDAIAHAIASGVPVVVSTRVPNGRVRPLYGFTGGGQTLKDLGAIFADDLSPQKARVLLMLALQAPGSADTIHRLFER